MVLYGQRQQARCHNWGHDAPDRDERLAKTVRRTERALVRRCGCDEHIHTACAPVSTDA